MYATYILTNKLRVYISFETNRKVKINYSITVKMHSFQWFNCSETH